MYNLNVSKRFSFKFGELIVVQSKLYTYTYFEEKENSEVNAADHQDRDQELEESRESSVPSMRDIGPLINKRNRSPPPWGPSMHFDLELTLLQLLFDSG